MKAEGANSPADVLLTVDIGRIDEAVQAGATQPMVSEALEIIIPPQYRDPNGHWAGISMRARVIYASRSGSSRTPLPMRNSPTVMEGQDLHPLRPAHLQQRVVRGIHREAWARPRPRNGSKA